MTSGDMVEAITRGQIDCIMGPLAWLKSFPLADSITHIYDYDIGALTNVGLMVVNADAWAEHTEAQKRKVWAAQPLAVARTTVMGYIGDNERSRKIAKEKGIVFTPRGQDVEQRWREFKAGEYDVAIKNAERLGIQNAREIADAFIANIAKWQKLLNDAGLIEKQRQAGADDAALMEVAKAFARLLEEHIYSKVDPLKL
jgi:hypothetical protein